ncbi:serine hydrolase [Aureibacillus halotolerans]|uniref:CubicO group peptidase (Beta-lactamase class C family) n=1 Tax=Aureibacillus halotolerans TaxID=1508390 RepID=A0A4R6TTX2_9BACI|nr:serine hydrolase [Aureibacillus halotolerans]TDQ36771.1 CubicO group peptidase (beta-lactamase class C family) [Aureibacillus halotolerans]
MIRSLYSKASAMLVLVMVLTVVVAPWTSVSAEEIKPLTPETAQAFLDEFFAKPETQGMFTGAAVSIVKDGEVLTEESHGLANIDANEGIDPEKTLFRVASVSKVFTAAAVLQLVEDGKIDLDTDIRTYIPGIPYENPFNEPVTVADLLAHTTGFEVRDPKPSDLHFDLSRNVSIEDYVKNNMPPVVREPGTSYLYGNFASLLQGLIVEKVSGEPFETYMQQNIFGPLGMTNSTFELSDAAIERMATGYGAPEVPVDVYAVTPTIMPHGGLLTTTSDMSLFMNAFLDNADTTNDVLSEETIGLMSTYHSSIHEWLPNTTYGFEAPFQAFQGGSSDQVIAKAGDLPGYSSYLWMIPEEDVGVFVTYTQSSALRNLLYSQFMSTFYPEYVAPIDFDDNYEVSQQELQKYEGIYKDLRIASMVHQVSATEEGTLVVKDAFLGEHLLAPVAPNVFLDDITGTLVAFQLEGDNVTYMKEGALNPMGYAQKGYDPEGFADISSEHAYAHYILPLQSLGVYENDATKDFSPDASVTRAAYVEKLLKVSGLRPSEAEVQFADVEGHPSAPYIQAALELGLVNGNTKGMFSPDEPISRQETAVIFYRSMAQIFPEGSFDEVKLAGDTSSWAVPAVKMMVALGYHGPEVTIDENGAAHFHSKEFLTKAEEAAQFYQTLTQPMPTGNLAAPADLP